MENSFVRRKIRSAVNYFELNNAFVSQANTPLSHTHYLFIHSSPPRLDLGHTQMNRVICVHDEYLSVGDYFYAYIRDWVVTRPRLFLYTIKYLFIVYFRPQLPRQLGGLPCICDG